MSKKLKLTALSTSRCLRSNQPQIESTSLESSPYFTRKNDHASTSYYDKNISSMKIENKRDEETTFATRLLESVNRLERSQRDMKTAKMNKPLNFNYKKSESVELKDEKSKKYLIREGNDEEQYEKAKDDLKNAFHWMPSNWESILENIKEMRKYKTAPVDEMGCHKCADPNATDPIFRYQCLLALMLSSQTKDQVTHAAMKRLISYGCTPSSIIAAHNDVIVNLIRPVGFAKKKAEYIKKTSVILLDKYNGDIPKTIDELCDLPGVGPKMAHICMQIAWGEISGIGVDTHVHRICNRLNWVKKPTKTPEATRKELEDWLPKDLWNDINYLLVGFGQEICLPRFPKCTECLNKNICPFAKGK